MKKSALATLAPTSVLALSLALAGCFGGEDAGTTPVVVPKDSTKTVKKVSPGLYVGDYSPYDTARRWESEFNLAQDGSYRFFRILRNEAISDTKGSWFQKDSNLHFTAGTETFIDQNSGFFGTGEALEDDTNSVRDITDSSFTRKEWTLLRQKPYWVSYKKKSFTMLQNGNYQFSRDIKLSDTTNLLVRIKIELNGTGFLYRYSEDSLESFQAQAVWFQQGSIFGTEQNMGRSYIDSTKTFSAWDTIPGSLLQRIDSVSVNGFQMWSPGSIFSPGSWDIYSKVP